MHRSCTKHKVSVTEDITYCLASAKELLDEIAQYDQEYCVTKFYKQFALSLSSLQREYREAVKALSELIDSESWSKLPEFEAAASTLMTEVIESAAMRDYSHSKVMKERALKKRGVACRTQSEPHQPVLSSSSESGESLTSHEEVKSQECDQTVENQEQITSKLANESLGQPSNQIGKPNISELETNAEQNTTCSNELGSQAKSPKGDFGHCSEEVKALSDEVQAAKVKAIFSECFPDKEPLNPRSGLVFNMESASDRQFLNKIRGMPIPEVRNITFTE